MSNNLVGNFPLLTYRNINLGSTGQIVKAYAGSVISMYISNTGAAPAYVKFYNKATAPISTDTPTHTLTLPAGSAVPWSPLDGINFTTGISARATTGVADNDTTSPGSNEVIVNIEYL